MIHQASQCAALKHPERHTPKVVRTTTINLDQSSADLARVLLMPPGKYYSTSCSIYAAPTTRATIPTERVYDFLHGEGRMVQTSFHRKAHPATQVQPWSGHT